MLGIAAAEDAGSASTRGGGFVRSIAGGGENLVEAGCK